MGNQERFPWLIEQKIGVINPFVDNKMYFR